VLLNDSSIYSRMLLNGSPIALHSNRFNTEVICRNGQTKIGMIKGRTEMILPVDTIGTKVRYAKDSSLW
jgi:hypothetical protein